MSERNAFQYQGMKIAKMKSLILNYIIFIFTKQSASNINLLIAIMSAHAKTLWIGGIFLLNLKTIFPQLCKYMAISDKMIEMISIFLRQYSEETFKTFKFMTIRSVIKTVLWL